MDSVRHSDPSTYGSHWEQFYDVFPLPVFDAGNTGIFGMVWGAFRYIIARIIFTIFAFPLIMLMVFFYRGLLCLVTFTAIVFVMGGFSYPGEFKGWSPSAGAKTLVNARIFVMVPLNLAGWGVQCLTTGAHCAAFTKGVDAKEADTLERKYAPTYPGFGGAKTLAQMDAESAAQQEKFKLAAEQHRIAQEENDWRFTHKGSHIRPTAPVNHEPGELKPLGDFKDDR